MVKAIQYIELRGDNPLRAVVAGTNSNAHLVATAAIVQGIEETAEQYLISIAQVHGALAFYHENREEIERIYQEEENDPTRAGISSKKFLEEIKKRKAVGDS